MNGESTFSWPKALAHSIAIAFAFFLPALVVSASRLVDATKAGEFSGGFIIAGLCLGWIWSYTRQQHYSTAKHVVVFILVAMSAYEVFVLAAAAATHQTLPSVSSLEQRFPAVLETASGRALCQDDFGLRLPLGRTVLSPAPDLAKTLRQKDPNDTVARWAYREGSGDIVVLMAANGFDSQESLERFAKGASRAAEGRMTKVQEAVGWEADHGTIVLSFRHAEGARLDIRCISAPKGSLGCLQTIGYGPDRLSDLRDRLSFGSCLGGSRPKAGA